jgi:hypothetical protein
MSKLAARPIDGEIIPPSRDATVYRSIDDHVLAIHQKWELLSTAAKRYRDIRLEVAMELRWLKQRVENGEFGDEAALDWWGFFTEHFDRSRDDAQHLLAIANKADPQAALDHQRKQTRIRNVNYRERQRQAVASVTRSSEPASEPDPDPSEDEPEPITPPPKQEEPLMDPNDIVERCLTDNRNVVMKAWERLHAVKAHDQHRPLMERLRVQLDQLTTGLQSAERKEGS